MICVGEIIDTSIDAAEMPPLRRLLVIHNPTAGARRLSRLNAVLGRLNAAGCQVSTVATGAAGDAERIAAAVDPASVDAVVAAGGDGTINEVANGLLAAAARGVAVPPLGIVPLGTANVLARELRLSTAPRAVVGALLHGRPRPVVLGRCEGAGGVRHFLMMAGVGFDAHVVDRVDAALKRRLGKGAYVWESLRGILNYRRQEFRLLIDGVPHQAASAIVARGHYYAGSYVVAPQARLELPMLHVCLFRRAGRWQVIRYATALLLNRLPNAEGYEVIPARHVEINGSDGDPIQGDGDTIGALPATITLAAQPLNLLVPDA